MMFAGPGMESDSNRPNCIESPLSGRNRSRWPRRPASSRDDLTKVSKLLAHVVL